MIGVEAAGEGIHTPHHAATITNRQIGVFHGCKNFVLQDEDGQITPAHSISAGLDYPGVGPEHSYWKSTGRVRYDCCRDDDALRAFDALARNEGILPALESSHAIAYGMHVARQRSPEQKVVICLSGRGDKDAAEVARLRGEKS